MGSRHMGEPMPACSLSSTKLYFTHIASFSSQRVRMRCKGQFFGFADVEREKKLGGMGWPKPRVWWKTGLKSACNTLGSSSAGLPVIPINRSMPEEQLCSLDEPRICRLRAMQWPNLPALRLNCIYGFPGQNPSGVPWTVPSKRWGSWIIFLSSLTSLQEAKIDLVLRGRIPEWSAEVIMAPIGRGSTLEGSELWQTIYAH